MVTPLVCCSLLGLRGDAEVVDVDGSADEHSRIICGLHEDDEAGVSVRYVHGNHLTALRFSLCDLRLALV